jgi:hypothetical protein
MARTPDGTRRRCTPLASDAAPHGYNGLGARVSVHTTLSAGNTGNAGNSYFRWQCMQAQKRDLTAMRARTANCDESDNML